MQKKQKQKQKQTKPKKTKQKKKTFISTVEPLTVTDGRLIHDY